MERADLLLTIAEIAIAFAGFASIVSVLGRRRSSDDPRLDALRLRAMLESALTVVVFALAPFIPNAFGLSEAATWRFAAIAFLIWNGIGLVIFRRRTRALAEQDITPPTRGYVALMLIVELLLQIPLLAVALGLFPHVAAALYLVALLTALLQAGIFFMRVVGSLLVAAAE